MIIFKTIVIWLLGALDFLAFFALLMLIAYDWSNKWWYTGYTSLMMIGVPALVLSGVIFILIIVSAKSGS